MYACGAGIDHRLHQFIRIQDAAKTGFRIGDDRGKVIDIALPFRPLDLVRALECIVDALDDHRYRVCRIQRLVRIHFTGEVGIASDLPARQVNRFQAGLDLLHGLVTSQCAERVDEGFVIDEVPQLFCAALGQRMFDSERTAQAHHVFCRISAGNAFPAWILGPFSSQCVDLLFASCHGDSPVMIGLTMRWFES